MDYLTKEQVEKLRKVVKNNRHGLRNDLIVLISFRHGLRAGELVSLEWSDIELDDGRLIVKRLKHGNFTHHYLQGDEKRLLRRLKRETETSRFVFNSERGDPLTTRGLGQIIKRAGKKLGWDISPHILRHSCGYHLANQGKDTRLIQDYLGHNRIDSTVRYTKTNPERFKDIQW